MKIFLTGQKQIGKSTCIQECIRECHKSVCGFLTLPFYEEQRRAGFYLHALHAMEHNDQRFSMQHETWNEVIPGGIIRISGWAAGADAVGILEACGDF